MSRSLSLLHQAVLKHGPIRHGLMLPPNPRAKYHEFAIAPTEDQLLQHLAGTITLATPATSNNLAACIVFDIDGHALDTITDLLKTACQRHLWAWGEWHVATNRGYVWIPFDHLTSAAALATLGQELVAATDLRPEQRRTLDNRTANQAITRLPFGRHTHTNQRGEVIFQDGSSAALDVNPKAALALWEARYQENRANQVTPIAAAPTAPSHAPRAWHPKNSGFTRAPEVQCRWNATHDMTTILMGKGGRQATRTSWHCPCGQHRNGDHTPSLRICTPKRDFYGDHIVQGYSPTCLFHSATDVFDAFNVYRLLHGLSNTEMLQLARRELGLDRADHAQTRPRNADAVQIPPPSRPVAQQLAQTMIAPPHDTPSTTEILARAGRDCTLSPATRTVLTTILAILNDRPTARIRLATLISQTSLARRTIQAALRRLEAADYLVIAPQHNDYGGHMANQYTLSAGGGRSPRSPLNINTWKGGQPAQPSVEHTADVSPPAPSADCAPPFHAQPAPEVAQVDADSPSATFDSVVYAAWVTTLDDQTERPWTYSRSPRRVMQGHEYGMAELRRAQIERGGVATSSALSAEPPAPRLRQTWLTLPAPVAAVRVAGVQALRGELVRIEREARRYFAQNAVNAGKQAQLRAATVRRQLAALEESLGDRPRGAALKAPARRKPPAPPSMLALGKSSDLGAVAVGDIKAGVAQLQGEGFAGSGLGQTVGGDGAADKLLGVGAAKGVHPQAGTGGNAERVTGSGDLPLGDAGKAARVGKDVVAVTRNGSEDGGVKQAGDEALATTLGVAAPDEDGVIGEINVLDAQAGDLVDAEASGDRQTSGKLDLAGEVANDGVGVGQGKPQAGSRAGRGGGNGGNKGGGVAPPTALAHTGFEFMQPGNGGAETAARQVAVFARSNVGDPVGVGDGAEFAQVSGVAFLFDPADGGDNAGLVGPKALVAKNNTRSGAVQLGLVTTGARAKNTVKGIGHLLDEGASWHGRSPPNGA